jgi:nucleoside-diphosphate-sugar epimerase
MNALHLNYLLGKYQITDVYCLTALLSASGEVNPRRTDELNMGALFNCLEAARNNKIKKLFWPSSIAAFGSNCPKNTPQ